MHLAGAAKFLGLLAELTSDCSRYVMLWKYALHCQPDKQHAAARADSRHGDILMSPKMICLRALEL